MACEVISAKTATALAAEAETAKAEEIAAAQALLSTLGYSTSDVNVRAKCVVYVIEYYKPEGSSLTLEQENALEALLNTTIVSP